MFRVTFETVDSGGNAQITTRTSPNRDEAGTICQCIQNHPIAYVPAITIAEIILSMSEDSPLNEDLQAIWRSLFESARKLIELRDSYAARALAVEKP